jgi:hypothetical protein
MLAEEGRGGPPSAFADFPCLALPSPALSTPSSTESSSPHSPRDNTRPRSLYRSPLSSIDTAQMQVPSNESTLLVAQRDFASLPATCSERAEGETTSSECVLDRPSQDQSAVAPCARSLPPSH